MIVAIDGPAASGKGTLARSLASQLSFAYLDTGKLYRRVALIVISNGGDVGNESDCLKAIKSIDLVNDPGQKLYLEETGLAASKLASIPIVRKELLDYQRFFSKNPGKGYLGAILDGRDIGTVVCPDANKKIYVTANFEVRVNRRLKELKAKGEKAIESQIYTDMLNRDKRDFERTVSPLKPAVDSWVLDTSVLNANQALKVALNYIRHGTL